LKKHNIFKTIQLNLVAFLLLAGIPVVQKLPLAVIHCSREVFNFVSDLSHSLLAIDWFAGSVKMDILDKKKA
jgi:hypothetical protein